MRRNPLRMIGKLMIEKLQSAVALPRRGEDTDAVVQLTLCARPLLRDESAAMRGGCSKANDRSADGRAGGGDGQRAGGQNEVVELDTRGVKRSEVAAQTSAPAQVVVGIERCDFAAEDGALRHGQPAVDVDRCKQASLNGLA